MSYKLYIILFFSFDEYIFLLPESEFDLTVDMLWIGIAGIFLSLCVLYVFFLVLSWWGFECEFEWWLFILFILSFTLLVLCLGNWNDLSDGECIDIIDDFT
jgi:hypothetical protein